MFSLLKEWPSGVTEITNNPSQYVFKATEELKTTFMEYLTYTTNCPLEPAKATGT